MKKKYLIIMFFLAGTFSGLFQANAQVTFSASSTQGCRPLPVTFTSAVAGTGNTYTWNFGDGSAISGAQNPSHTFKHAGGYYITLNVSNSNGAYLGGNSMYISVNGISDSINVTTHQACLNDQVGNCLNVYGNYPSSIIWNFGDGYVTSNSNSCMDHAYTALGTYTITAIGKTSCGVDTAFGIIQVTSNAQITGNPYFSLQSDSICQADPAVFFVDWSYQNYALDFGDGNTITHAPSQNGNNNNQITHLYAAVGNYPVKMTYFNSCGNSKVIYDTVHVVSHHQVTGSVSIDFNYGQHQDTTCINSYIQFYPNANAFTAYKWNFGGGVNDTSTAVTPTHKFTALGKFVVSLTVTNGCGNSKTVTDTVKIVNTLPFGGLSGQVTPTTICAGQAILYNSYPTSGNSGGNNDPSYSFVWNFNDGTIVTGNQGTHDFAALGTYTVKCVGQNSCGSKDSLTNVITVANGVTPVKTDYRYMSTSSGRGSCPGDSVLFVFGGAGNGTVHWDFGDATSGNATKTITFQNTEYRFIKHAYVSQGYYVATVTYTNSCLNSFSDTLGTSIIPHASDFGSGNGNIIVYDNTVYPCQGTPIPFYALEGSSYVWNFGDGTGNLVTHQSLSPVFHAFQNSGKFLVTCKAINECGNSATDSVTVNIPASLIKITTNSVNSHCHQNNGKAIAVVSGGTAPYSYQWSNGKSKYIDDSIPSGIYVINVTDKNGCTNFKIATVNDAQAPTIAVGSVINVSCYGGNDGAISLNLIGGAAPYTFNWSTGATTQSINNQVAGPKEITVTDVNGCTASKSILIGQSPPVTVSIVAHAATCGVADGSATAAVNGTTGPYSYVWSNNANTAINSGISPGNYTVTVVDNNGCLFYSDATVSNVNGPYIYQDSITGTGCGNALTKIYTHAAGGTAPYTYSWSNGATTPDLTNGGVGNYELTVIGHNGCQTVASFNILHDNPAGLPVCMVTVDSATNTNQVLWYNAVSTQIAHYNIYKESSQNGLYYLVDTVNYHQISQWTDPAANPQIRSWKYKISIVDQCGDESPLSAEHKTIHLNVNQGLGGAYNLIWDEYTGFSYSSFNIFRYSPTGGWVQIAIVPANVLSYTDATPPVNTYDYKVEAVATFSCAPQSHAAINSTRSNIKTILVSPLGTDNVMLNEQVSLYPNPSEGTFSLSFPASTEGYQLKVYDAIGQVVYSSEISKEESSSTKNSRLISLGVHAPGLYFLTLDNNQTRIYKKLIVQ